MDSEREERRESVCYVSQFATRTEYVTEHQIRQMVINRRHKKIM